MSDPALWRDDPEPQPATLYALLDGFRSYLALDDVAHIVFAVAVAVTSHLDGDPVWGQLIGPSSGGKTEAIRALDDIADEHPDEISAAGLLGWVVTTRGKGRPSGVLAGRVGRVFITVADFSTVLATSDRGGRDQLFGLLRRAYDGRVERVLGGVPEPLVWTGRLTLLSAVTPEVDRFRSHTDALGPRWLSLRMADTDDRQRRAASKRARKAGTELTAARARVREHATAVVRAAAGRVHGIETSDELGEVIDDAVVVACLGRASVPRHGYGRREIDGAATIEEPPRMAGQLDQLARALLALDLDAAAVAALCRRVALDSMPPERRAVLDVLSTGEPLYAAAVARLARLDRSVTTRTLEDLAAIGVVTFAGADSDDEDLKRGAWTLCGENATAVARVMSAAEHAPKSGDTPISPPNREKREGAIPHFGASSGRTDRRIAETNGSDGDRAAAAAGIAETGPETGSSHADFVTRQGRHREHLERDNQ